jgi:hypothetical protein
MNIVKGIFAGLALALLMAGCVVRDDNGGYGRDYAHGSGDYRDQGRGSDHDRDYDRDRDGDHDHDRDDNRSRSHY